MSPLPLKEALEHLYEKYNRREFIHPDPLEFLYCYDNPRDREIAGLIASSLAYGRVSQILKSISKVLEKMSPSPFRFLEDASMKSLLQTFSDFKHRFTTGDELAVMLFGAKCVIAKHGSLHACFKSALSNNADTIRPALTSFVKELRGGFNAGNNSLLPSPEKGSACKRLNLFLRWMVRKDSVDPGGWDDVPPAKLIVPLDTHLHRICLILELTKRKQADMRTAIEITDSFRIFDSQDPARYDFALTRLGIRQDARLETFLYHCRTRKVA